MKAKLYFPKLWELFKKDTRFVKSLKVIANGQENNYPEYIERLNNNSITSVQCHKLFRQFITGKGFEGQNETIVNKIKDTTLFAFLNLFNDDYALQKGVAVHVQYTTEGKKSRFKVIPFSHVRKGKEDDAKYNSMFGVSDKWDHGKVKTDDIIWYHRFNDDPEIVQEQIQNAKGIDKYKGQIFFFNPSRYDYPLAPLNPVINDADSEFRIGIFRNKNLRKGVFGKKIFVIPPIIDPQLRERERDIEGEQLSLLNSQKRISSQFQEALNGFVGVENNEGFMTLEMEYDGDDISKAINVVDIKTDIDDKMFENSEEKVVNNIRRAYNNVPSVLIENKDSGVFSDSAALIESAKLTYQENTKDERMLIEQAFERLFRGFEGINTAQLNIEPLIDEEEIQEEESDANALAQAELRGSVGGVTALLQIQQSVAQKTTDVEAGVAMIQNIYGFDEATARQMLGNPEQLPVEPNTF